MSLMAMSSSPFLTSVFGIGTSAIERSSSGYRSCSIANPPSIGRKQDVLAFGELVPFDHLLLLDLLAVFGADVLLLETGPVLLMEPVERDVRGRLAGGEQFDRHRHEAEGDRGRTNGMSAHK